MKALRASNSCNLMPRRAGSGIGVLFVPKQLKSSPSGLALMLLDVAGSAAFDVVAFDLRTSTACILEEDA